MIVAPWLASIWAGGSAARPTRRLSSSLLLVALASFATGALAFFIQATQNHRDADERFEALSRRVTQGIVERLRRYEYGLRGTRGVVVAANGALTRDAFSRYAATRQIDLEFPGARGFGIVYLVRPADEAAFIKARRELDSPDFSIRALTPHTDARFVITYVEPLERNREAIGLDIASEPARREAALRAASSSQATLTAPITLIQASGRKSGGLLLLLPIRREASGSESAELIGWSYAPLLIEDILRGLDAEDEHFALSLFDLDQSPDSAFYATGKTSALATDLEVQRVSIPLYGRRWEAQLRPTALFVQSLHQSSPWAEGLKASLLGCVLAALFATGARLIDRTRGQVLEQARRAAIVEGSDDAIIVQNLDGTITDWNDGAMRLFGFRREEAIGKSATELLLPPELEEEDKALRSTVASGNRVHVFESIRHARDGANIPVSITASPIHDSDGVVVGSAKILRDVRAARAAEQRMRELNESLEDQVKERTALLDDAMREAREANEAKSRFLANISHEIRTPMNAVIGLSHMLERTRLDADQTSMLTRIRQASKTLMALLNDVLDLSKIEAGEMSLEAIPFQIGDVVDEVSSIVGVSAAQRGVSFSVSVHGAVPGPLIGDSTRLAQILLNLLSNAIKFTPHGSVELNVRVGDIDSSGLQPVSLRVSDTGIGISEEVQRRLFQPFVQADASTTRRFGGTGLGLSIVRQLVTLTGGKIGLESEPGKGSTFWVDLSFAVAPPEVRPTTRAGSVQAPNLPLRGVRLLVVDDNALNREVAERILCSEGASVVLASDGQQALDLLNVANHGFQALLMDVQMPVMDGLDATRQIRAMPGLVRLPIVGLTAGVSSDERRVARDAGMDVVVGKPFDPSALVATVAKLLNLSEGPAIPTESSCPPEWPVVNGLDALQSFKNLKGDHELFGRMFISLREMLDANDHVLAASPPSTQLLSQHAKRLHDLKAVAGTLGSDAIKDAAGKAEQLLRAARWKDAISEMSTVAALGRLLGRPQALSPALSSAPGSAALSRPGLDDGQLANFIKQLRSRDLAALASSRALDGAFRTALGDNEARLILELVQSLDFATAEQVIQRSFSETASA